MSKRTSPTTGQPYGIRLTCQALDLPRSTYYSQKAPRELTTKKRGPKPGISDGDLFSLITEDLAQSPFHGEGHRKVSARLHRSGKKVGRNRVLRIMRSHRLLSPHRSPARTAKVHDKRITTDEPNQMWGTDGLKVLTLREGWVWVFPVVEHWNTECLGFHVTKYGDRFAALAPISSALMKRFGSVEKGVAQGMELAVRLDHGSQYRAEDFRNQLKAWGIRCSPSLVRQPETNGVVERFNRTLREQVIHGQIFEDTEDLRRAIGEFVEVYNREWLVAKLGYRTPAEAYKEWELKHAA